MSRAVDGELLAERTATVLAHLDRVAAHLPADPADLRPMSSPTDTVVLHLWQAIQVVIDLATATCVRLGLGSPPTYGDAFRRLAEAGILDPQLGTRLARAAASHGRRRRARPAGGCSATSGRSCGCSAVRRSTSGRRCRRTVPGPPARRGSRRVVARRRGVAARGRKALRRGVDAGEAAEPPARRARDHHSLVLGAVAADRARAGVAEAHGRADLVDGLQPVGLGQGPQRQYGEATRTHHAPVARAPASIGGYVPSVATARSGHSNEYTRRG